MVDSFALVMNPNTPRREDVRATQQWITDRAKAAVPIGTTRRLLYTTAQANRRSRRF